MCDKALSDNECPSLGQCPLITLSLHERPSAGGIVCCVLLLNKEVFCYFLPSYPLVLADERKRTVNIISVQSAID